jgi:transcriptional regulator
MYRPSPFAVDDMPVLHAFIRDRNFATIATAKAGHVRFAYVPVMLDAQEGTRGGVRYHLARGNELAALQNGDRVRLSFLGPHAYVSPDWYETPRLVPTWNYSAVEGAGTVRRLDDRDLRTLLVDLSAAEEEKLRPKVPWTLDKIPEDRVATLLRGICGFAVAFDMLAGKFKLSQDKAPADVAGVVGALKARGDAASRALAETMMAASPSPPV